MQPAFVVEEVPSDAETIPYEGPVEDEYDSDLDLIGALLPSELASGTSHNISQDT